VKLSSFAAQTTSRHALRRDSWLRSAGFVVAAFQRDTRITVPSMRHALGPTRDAVDLPNLSGEVDDIRGVPDELERGRPVQRFRDDGEGTVSVDLDERAGVRQCRRTRIAARPVALRERRNSALFLNRRRASRSEVAVITRPRSPSAAALFP
jgi:hypothetical protein